VREGDRVVAGQVLVVLDDSEARQALAQRQAAVRTAQQTVAEARSAYEASRVAVEAAIARARAGVRVAEAGLRDAKRETRKELIAQAEHALELARAVEAECSRKLDRAERLYAEGVYSLAARDAARTEHQVAVARVSEAEDSLLLLRAGPRPEDADQARARLEAARVDLRATQSQTQELQVRRDQMASAIARVAEAQAAVRQAQAEIARYVIKSPVAGSVVSVFVEPGVMASPAQASLALASRDDLHVEAEVRSEDIAAVVPGQRVELLLPGQSSSSRTGIVERLAAQAEPKSDSAIRTRIVRCRIRIVGDVAHLVPGQELDVRFKSRRVNVLTVPTSAIALDGAAPSVWLIEKGRSVRKIVELGATDGAWIEITAGLEDGTTVIMSIPPGLTEGQPVVARDGP
jgi:HlyD family secretion protein